MPIRSLQQKRTTRKTTTYETEDGRQGELEDMRVGYGRTERGLRKKPDVDQSSEESLLEITSRGWFLRHQRRMSNNDYRELLKRRAR